MQLIDHPALNQGGTVAELSRPAKLVKKSVKSKLVSHKDKRPSDPVKQQCITIGLHLFSSSKLMMRDEDLVLGGVQQPL
jgi:hypothetical protein